MSYSNTLKSDPSGPQHSLQPIGTCFKKTLRSGMLIQQGLLLKHELNKLVTVCKSAPEPGISQEIKKNKNLHVLQHRRYMVKQSREITRNTFGPHSK